MSTGVIHEHSDAEGGDRSPKIPVQDVQDFKDEDLPRSRVSRVFERLDDLLRMGRIEAKGIQPIPVEERKSTRFWNIFTVWCSMNTNILG